MNRAMENGWQRGMLPVILGTAVTITGLGLVNSRHRQGRRRRYRPFAWGMTGFGLAHILLGTIYRVMNNEGKANREKQKERESQAEMSGVADLKDDVNLNSAHQDIF